MDQDPKYHSQRFSKATVKRFRQRMQLIRSANNEQDFYALKSLHFEKLKGDRKHQRSMRIDDQFRLIIQIQEEPAVVVVIGIEDYH